MVISGHKDQAFIDYVEAHSKAGNFKDKFVVLFSCYQHGDEALNHRLIKEGGAKGILFFMEEINPLAVRETLFEMLKLIESQQYSEQQVKELIERSVENAKSKAPKAFGDEIEKMSKGTVQLSDKDFSQLASTPVV